jgi:NHL repeat-containing protein
MRHANRRQGGYFKIAIMAGACAVAAFGVTAQAQHAQQAQYPKPTDLPNPYRLVEGWPTLPKSMNGGHWGEVSRVQIDSVGNIWVFHRCFATEPPGSAVCLGANKNFPPLLKFDPSGKLLASLGTGLFVYPHGFTIDGDGNLWTTDVNDKATVLGMSAKNAAGVVMGQEVLKLDPASGKVLMTLGTEGVTGNGSNTFDMPPGVAVAANGDVFVTDGHRRNELGTGRVVKFDRNGKFIKTWGHMGPEPGNFNDPHDIAIGGSEDHVYIADRQNRRIQVFDQDGNFLAAWPQFGEVNSVFVSKDDTIYAGTGFADPNATKGEIRGILVGSAKDGSLRAFIPDPVDLNTVVRGTAASGITADYQGNIYAADVGSHNLRKYVLERHL